jgi:hypothetical protein
MTMWNTSLVIFKKGALKNIGRYSGYKSGECFNSGFIEKEFNLEKIWRIPRGWYDRIEFLDQMDYGSWLYSCDRKTLLSLFDESGIDHVPLVEGYEIDESTGKCTRVVRQIPVSEIPVRKKYGLLEMEIY